MFDSNRLYANLAVLVASMVISDLLYAVARGVPATQPGWNAPVGYIIPIGLSAALSMFFWQSARRMPRYANNTAVVYSMSLYFATMMLAYAHSVLDPSVELDHVFKMGGSFLVASLFFMRYSAYTYSRATRPDQRVGHDDGGLHSSTTPTK